MSAVGEHVRARQQPGVVFKTPQVQNRRQNVHIAAVFVHHDVFLQAAYPEDQGRLVLGEAVNVVTDQLGILAVLQAVGEMISGNDNGGSVCHPRLLQPLHQIADGLVKLDVAAQVCLDGVAGIGQILHLIPVPLGHFISAGVVFIVTGEGHVVGVEGFFPDVIIHGLLHHFQIRGRPVGGEGHAVPGEFHGVAHVGVRLIPTVIAAPIVVIAEALHPPLRLKHIAQGEGKIAAPGGIQAGHCLAPPGIRIQALHQGVLAVGGGIGEGIIIVVEDDPLLGQLVQIGGQILVDGSGGKALRAHDNQVVVLQHSGVFVLIGAGNLGTVVIDCQQLFVLGHGVQGIKVNVHNVVLDLGRLLGLVLPLGLLRNIIVLLLRFGMAGQLQPDGRQQAKSLGGLVGGDFPAAVIVLIGEHFRARLPDACPGQGKQGNRQHQQRNPPLCPKLPFQPFSQENPQRQGHHQSDEPGKMIPHGGKQLPPEVGHGLPALGYHSHGIQRAENEMIDNLAAVKQGQHRRQEYFRSKTPFSQKGQDKCHKQRRGQRKAQGVDPHPKAVKHRPAQQALPVH